jgi:hypothetical protein
VCKLVDDTKADKVKWITDDDSTFKCEIQGKVTVFAHHTSTNFYFDSFGSGVSIANQCSKDLYSLLMERNKDRAHQTEDQAINDFLRGVGQ